MSASGERSVSPSLFRRAVRFGFDLMSLFLLYLLLVWLMTLTPLWDKADAHLQRCAEIQSAALEECGGDRQKAEEILSGDPEYREELFAYELRSYLLKAACAAAAETVLFLIVPLRSETRSTAGMALTDLGLFDPSALTWAPGAKVFYRFLFILLIDSLALYPWTGLYTFLLVPVLRVIQLMLFGSRRTICDYLTGTRTEEIPSAVPIN